MPANRRPWVLLLLVLALFLAGATACSMDTARGFREDDEPRMATASDGGQEEVLSPDDDDEFPPRDRKPASVAGEFLVVVGYIGMMLGSAVLPFLLL